MMNVYDLAVEIAKYACLPENRDANGAVNWNYVSADVYMDYEWMTEEMFDRAVNICIQAMSEPLTGVPVGAILH